MIGIYKITNPKNRGYIGQSIDVEFRLKTYKREFGIAQPKIFNSLKKYGVDNHKFEIVIECEVHELNDYERYYQELYNCVEHGLNCNYVRASDRSGKVSEETRLKMIKAQTGNKKWLGKKHTEETKLKMRTSMKGIKRSPEFCLAISNRMKGKPTTMISPNTRIVLDVVHGIFYESLKEASKSYNIKYSTLKAHMSSYRINRTNLIYV